ncbi:ImuA family protein [Shimia biformata]|uniref:ImuA family protein n=1 Tax=Shimia biformata TaxID=1294299 RepID=UPI00195193EE|nr:hypothetical protein [Shimia biformata]
MPIQTFRRAPERARPEVALGPGASLVRGRAHEGCGAARRTFALWLAARMDGPVFWIAPDWAGDRLNPDGVARFLNPARLTFLSPRRPEDVLWTMEEALRAGAVPLVVADIPGLPGLTPVRRLHLAAETGAAEGDHVPLGLLLTPGNGGAQGVESRWRMAPAHRGEDEGWTLHRLRARTAPEKHWQVAADGDGLRLVDTPAAAQAELALR